MRNWGDKGERKAGYKSWKAESTRKKRKRATSEKRGKSQSKEGQGGWTEKKLERGTG